MAFTVNSKEYYHWQMSCSSHLKAVIISFFFRGGWRPPLWAFSHSIFPASSSTVVSWLPITFLSLVGPGRTTAIQGFSKATPPAEMVTVSPRITLVASKFSLLTEAVTTSMYHLSPSAWSDRVRGLASLTTNPVVGTT